MDYLPLQESVRRPTTWTHKKRLLYKAQDSLKKGKRNDAVRFALQALKRNPTPEQAAELNRLVASVYVNGARPEEALPYARKAFSYARQGDDYYSVCAGEVLLGQTFARMNRYRDACRAWKEALRTAKENQNLRIQGRILLNMAILEQKRGKHKTPLEILKQAEYCADMVGDFNGLATCYGRMVIVYLELDEIDSARMSCRKMEKLAARMNIKRLKASAAFYKGSVAMKLSEYKKALTPFQRSASIYEELGDTENQIAMLTNLASAYMGVERIERAEALLKKATRLARYTGSESLISMVKLSHAELAVYRKNLIQAMAYYMKTLELAEKINNENRFIAFHESIKDTLEIKHVLLPDLALLLKRARRSYKKLGLLKQDKEAKEWLARDRLSDK